MSDDENKRKIGLSVMKVVDQPSVFRSLVIGEDLMEAHNATGISAIQKAIDSSTNNSVGRILEATQMRQFDTGVGSAIREMTERNALFADRILTSLALQKSPFSEMLERYRAPALGIQKALEVYRTSLPATGIQIGSSLHGFDFSRIGQTFERLSVDRVIGSEFASISQRMAEQVKAFRIAETPNLNFELSASISDLLARSLEAQEALLDEQQSFIVGQRTAESAATDEARFHRRMAYFNTLIAVLYLFLMIAFHLEGRSEADENAAAEQIELAQMRETFVSMSEQLEELRLAEEESADREEAEAKREAAADAELASIMREIADGLNGQEDEPDPAP